MATMLWSLVQAIVMKMRASTLTEKKTISGVKYWVLKENYLYSREKCVAAIDNRYHYIFSDYQTV